MIKFDLSKNISSGDIENQINKIKSIELNIDNYSILLKEIAILLLSNSLILTVMHKAPQKIYRARKFTICDIEKNTPSNIDELWYNKPGNIISFGRCNLINQSIFYCGIDSNSVIFELKPSVNDIFIILECELKPNVDNLSFVTLGINEHLNRSVKVLYQSKIRHFEKLFKEMSINCLSKFDLSDKHIEGAKLINDFIFDEFTKEIKEKDQNEYLRTIAISQLLMYPPHNFIIESFYRFNGIIYPSINSNLIKRSSSGINIAIPPDIVDRYYEPSNVEAYYIIEKTTSYNKTKIESKKSSPIKEITREGNIVW